MLTQISKFTNHSKNRPTARRRPIKNLQISKWGLIALILACISTSVRSAKDPRIELLISNFIEFESKGSQSAMQKQTEAEEFEVLEYLMNQPEMEEVTQFNEQELQCLALRRMVSSAPFNNEVFDPNFFQKVRDEYQATSMRTLSLKLLVDEGFVTKDEIEENKALVGELVFQKKTFMELLSSDEKQNLPIVAGNWDKVKEAATEEITKLSKQKIKVLTVYNNTQMELLSLSDQIKSLSDKMIQENQFLEQLVVIYQNGEEFIDALESAQDRNLFTNLPFIQKDFKQNQGLMKEVSELSHRMKELQIFEKSKNWLEWDSERAKEPKTASLIQELEKQIRSKLHLVNSSRNKAINFSKKLMEQIHKTLKENLDYARLNLHIENYKSAMLLIKIHYRKLSEINREVDKLQFLFDNIDPLKPHLDQFGDYIIGFETETIFEAEIHSLFSRADGLNELVQLSGSYESPMLNSLKSWEGWNDRVSFNPVTLNQKVTTLKRILELESILDVKLGKAMGQARKIMTNSGSNGNSVPCLDEIEMGHLILNMARYYMIVDIGTFVKAYMDGWDMMSTRMFVMKNYGIFTSREYRGRIVDSTSIHKWLPEEERVEQVKMVEDYILRIGFFVNLFRTRSIEVDFTQRKSFFGKQGLLFRNMAFNLWGRVKNTPPEQIVAAFSQILIDQIVDIIPFGSKLKALVGFLVFLIKLAINEIINFMIKKFGESRYELQYVWRKVYHKVRSSFGIIGVQNVNTEKFFKENSDFMDFKSQCWKFDFCYEEPTVHFEDHSFTSKYQFDFSSLQAVNDQYKEVLSTAPDKQKKSKGDFNYLRQIGFFRANNYLLTRERIKENRDLMLTTLVYYRTKVSLNPEAISEIAGRLLLI